MACPSGLIAELIEKVMAQVVHEVGEANATGPSASPLLLLCRLLQEGGESPLVDVGALEHLDVSHELSLAVEETFGILEGRACKESKLNMIVFAVHIGNRSIPFKPAAVSPTSRIPEAEAQLASQTSATPE